MLQEPENVLILRIFTPNIHHEVDRLLVTSLLDNLAAQVLLFQLFWHDF